MFDLRLQGLAVRVLLAAVSVLAVSRSAESELVTPRPLSVYDSGVVRRAVEGARSRLQAASCEGLVDEFKDVEGRPLRDRLAEAGTTLEARLDVIRFVDASESAYCRRSQTYAFAVRDAIVVYVCPRVMEKALRQRPTRVQSVVIHELLHTIGLGENPPTSSYITARVEARCLSN